MPRETIARTTRKMHVPAYWPTDEGIQCCDQSGVEVEVVKYIDIVDMSIDMEELCRRSIAVVCVVF